ncbi:phosphotransferase family protein [Halosimplex halophilum]|uniref:phosphotransferase family protein n=1 Tax=Halosimplex halophilum TaxID=2559572 RepID=UPI00107F799A|nr:phosphotransferase [Halosimplex halophilum]
MTDRTIPHAQITELLARIRPTWTVESATPASDGSHVVYFLDVATPNGPRECVLKATRPDQSPVCDDEARVLAVLGAHTDLPVPAVFGAVDDDPDLPTPAFLASVLPGANHSRTAFPEFSPEAIRELGRSTGRLLAELHRFDAVDAYGFVGVDHDGSLDGGRPSADPASITVHDPADDWTGYLRGEIERLDDALADARFADLRGEVLPALDAAVDDLAGEFRPALCRIDQSLDNSLVDPESGAVTGLLDWEFAVAATPAYDLAFVEHTLAGGHWPLLPDQPDYGERVREGLLAGYREAGPNRVVEQFRRDRECYALLVEVHSMLNFDSWFDLRGVDSGGRREAAADALRDRARRYC